MITYDQFHELLNLAEAFEKESGREFNLTGFAAFLADHANGQVHAPAVPELRFGEEEPAAQDLAYQLDNNISRLLIFMHRYAKFYLKKALEGTPLQTPEDFTCLAILLTHEQLSKTALIQFNIQEKTSGTVVIARLIKAGLIQEEANNADKRGKLISITADGKALLYRVFEHTGHVGKLVTGRLSQEEKRTLQQLLQKLEDFHHPIQEQKLVSSRADLGKLAQQLRNG